VDRRGGASCRLCRLPLTEELARSLERFRRDPIAAAVDRTECAWNGFLPPQDPHAAILELADRRRQDVVAQLALSFESVPAARSSMQEST